MRVLLKILPWLLVLDALDGVVWVWSLTRDLTVMGGVALAIVAARVIVGALEAMSARLLMRGEPSAPTLTIMALVGTATLTTLVVGLGLAPSDIPPGIHTNVIAGYWLFAVVGVAVVRIK